MSDFPIRVDPALYSRIARFPKINRELMIDGELWHFWGVVLAPRSVNFLIKKDSDQEIIEIVKGKTHEN